MTRAPRRAPLATCAALVLTCSAGVAGADEAAPGAGRTEVGGIPVVAYDSDRGLLLGALVNVARLEPDAAPFAYRLELLVTASFKQAGGEVEVPLHDDSVTVDVPGLLGGLLRVVARVGFQSFRDAGWYGPGGDSVEDTSIDRFHAYERVYPGAAVNTRWRLARSLELLVGAQVEASRVTAEPGSLLARQIAIADEGTGADAAVLADVLRGTDTHVLGKLRVGLLRDTRDDEFQPTRGTLVELAARAAPVPWSLRHVGLFASAAGFVPIAGGRLVVGGRVFADALVGRPPFYALAEAGVSTPVETSGGASTVRGVALQRFAGKIKLVANAELRAEIGRFRLGKQRLRIGALGFLDAARTRADWHDVTLDGRDVDGPWTRIATGVGVGARAAWGETLVIRVDAGISPTEETTGLYIGVGHVF